MRKFIPKKYTLVLLESILMLTFSIGGFLTMDFAYAAATPCVSYTGHEAKDSSDPCQGTNPYGSDVTAPSQQVSGAVSGAAASTGAGAAAPNIITTDPAPESGRPIINCGERGEGGIGILPGCQDGDALDTGNLVLGRLVPYLISWSIGIMGLVAFFFIVEAGIQLVLSQGNAEKAKAAEKTIISASIGLVIATLSFILVSIASNFNLF
ncbi:MAG: pilin [Candidatus Gracilibacteria bacterium]